MPRGGLLSRGRDVAHQMGWWPQSAAAGLVRLEDKGLEPELREIVREFRARYARHCDSLANPSRAEIRETLRRIACVIDDAAMLPAVRILDSATMMHLRGVNRAVIRDTSMPGAPLIGGPERIRHLARRALEEMPADRGGKRAPKGIDLMLARRLILYWNARRRDKAMASKISTPFTRFFQDAFKRAERPHELDPLSLIRQIGDALRSLKKEGYTPPRK